MTVGKAIYHLLTNATDVTDIVSTRIYPEIAQQDADLPYIVYAIANNEPTDTKPEPSKLDTAQVEVNIYSDSYTQAIDLAVAVRAALDRVKGTYSGVNVQSIQYLNEIIDFDEPQRAYNISADYDVRISRSRFEIAQGSPITGVQLGELSDVDVTGVSNGQVIAYNNHSQNWEAANAGGGATTLDELTDTQVSNPSAGTILSWNGAYWVAIAQSTPPATTDALSEGATNLYYTDARVSANSDVTANKAKTSFPGFGTSAGTALEGDTALLQLGTTSTTALAGNTTTISTEQANAITANTAKVSYTDAAAVAANTAKTSFPGFGTSAGTALEGDTALLQLGTSSTTALAGDTTTITTDQANAITANTAKNSYPSADASKLAGIETAADVTDATNVAAAGALMASSAQLTGNLDTQANEINTTTSNGNVKVAANGTGLLEVRGNVGGGSDDNPGAIKLNCAQNSHGITIKSPPHANGASYTLTLPDNDGDANQVLQTDGSGNLSWVAQTGGSGGGMTETPLMTVTGRATFSSADDNESVVLGGSYGIGNYFQHTEELGDYDASAVIDSTTYSQTPYKHINTAIHLPSDSKKVRAKISYRIDDAETSQTWGFSIWSANNPSGTSSYDMTLRGRSTDTTPASTSSIYVYNKEFTTTSAITDDAIYFVIDHRTGSISSTTYIYFTLTLFLVD